MTLDPGGDGEEEVALDIDREDEGAVVRALGVVAAPFVIVWDGFLRCIEGFFGAAERLDPLALIERLFAPIAPHLRRFAVRIGEITAAYWKALARIFRAPVELLTRGVSWLGLIGRQMFEPVRRFFGAVLRATVPIREGITAAWQAARSAMQRILEPARRLRQSMAHTARRILRRREE